MDSRFIVNSIGIGGVFFVGLIIFWFVFVYLKRQITSDQSNPGISAATKISWEEKRQHPRVEISWSASIEHPDKPQAVQLRDISLGGAFVICEDPLALQDQCKITIDLSDPATLQLNAEVVWSNANMPREKVINRGMGIRFINNEELTRQQLQDAITDALENADESIEGTQRLRTGSNQNAQT